MVILHMVILHLEETTGSLQHDVLYYGAPKVIIVTLVYPSIVVILLNMETSNTLSRQPFRILHIPRLRFYETLSPLASWGREYPAVLSIPGCNLLNLVWRDADIVVHMAESLAISCHFVAGNVARMCTLVVEREPPW